MFGLEMLPFAPQQSKWLISRAAVALACTAVIVLAGVVVFQSSPIYWWMSTAAGPLPFGGRSYSPVGTLEPMLGRLSEVMPLAPGAPGRCNVLLSQHAHTVHSDGSMTVQQTLEWHRAHGYTAVAVTDHNTWSGGLEAVAEARKLADGPVALAGMEWTHCRGHYNFLLPSEAAASLRFQDSAWLSPGKTPDASPNFLRPDVATSGSLKIPFVKYPSDHEMREAFAAVHALGGVVVANHLAWSSWSLERDRLPTREELEEWGVDYVELASQHIFDAQSLEHVKEHKIGAIAGGDVHFPTQHAYGWTCLSVANPRDGDSILAALRRPADVDLLFDAAGSPNLLQGAIGRGDDLDSWPAMGIVFAPLRWVGQLATQFYRTSSDDGEPLYEYSFVDGFCGPPRGYGARWPFILSAAAWAALLFSVYHSIWWLAQGATKPPQV